MDEIITLSADFDGSTALTAHLFSEHKEWMRDRGLVLSNSPTENTCEYRGSRRWSTWRDDDGWKVYNVDVGCWCEHDCCGHLCTLRYAMKRRGNHIIVEKTREYNY